jgi:hypothetical protein
VAAAAGDLAAINRLTTEGELAQPTQYMMRFVSSLARSNATFEVVSIRRSHGEILVSVQYRFPNGFANGVLWHVRQTAQDWRVDCRATATGFSPQPRTGR